jgi:type VI secretion system protein ImpK
MFLCLSLGMMGPYRTLPDGAAQLERARHHVFEIIEGAAPKLPPGLAPAVNGIEVPPPPRGGIPVWVAGSVALALVAAVHVWSLTTLNAESDAVYRAALAAPPTAMPALVRPAATPPPPPPPEPPPGPEARIRGSLAGLPDVEVVTSPAAIILRIPAGALFPQPNATLAASPLLDRVAAALDGVPGPIRVLGYTDNQPAHTVGFPSNFALSAARAKAVRAALARSVPQPARITAEGHADGDPVAPNATPEGRERNRRIDIQLARSP